jgi:hypothetical protein
VKPVSSTYATATSGIPVGHVTDVTYCRELPWVFGAIDGCLEGNGGPIDDEACLIKENRPMLLSRYHRECHWDLEIIRIQEALAEEKKNQIPAVEIIWLHSQAQPPRW